MSFSSRARRAFTVFLFAVVAWWGGRAEAAGDESSAPIVTDDLVVLTNGHSIKGHIVYEVARAYLRMLLEDGKIVTIPWSEIDRVDLSPARPATPATPWNVPEEVPGPPVDDDDQDETVRVTFDADEDTVLEQQSRETGKWKVVCRGKCSDELLLHANYRTNGGGARTSGVFRIKADAGDNVLLTSQAHSRAAFGIGIALLSVGGVGMLAMGAHSGNHDSSSAAGAWDVMTLTSMALTALGTVMIVANPKSKVLQRVSNVAFGTITSPVAHRSETASVTPSRANDSWRQASVAQLAPVARTSSLFTIHF